LSPGARENFIAGKPPKISTSSDKTAKLATLMLQLLNNLDYSYIPNFINKCNIPTVSTISDNAIKLQYNNNS